MLFAGIGPLAESNPRLLNLLGFAQERPAPDARKVDELITDFLKFYPGFETEILPKMKSGNATDVEAALKHFTHRFEDYVRATTPVKPAKTKGEQVSTNGTFVTNTEVAVNGAAVANVILYANVGVATFVLVAGGAVVVALVVVSYLSDGSSMVDSTATKLERQTAVAELTKALTP